MIDLIKTHDPNLYALKIWWSERMAYQQIVSKKSSNIQIWGFIARLVLIQNIVKFALLNLCIAAKTFEVGCGIVYRMVWSGLIGYGIEWWGMTVKVFNLSNQWDFVSRQFASK